MVIDEVPRARRYQVAFAIRYRQRKQRRWQNGLTQNVSATGVLFGEAAREARLQLDASLEMELTIPSDLPGGVATRIFCSGRVARIVDAGIVDWPRIVAATIAKYRLGRA